MVAIIVVLSLRWILLQPSKDPLERNGYGHARLFRPENSASWRFRCEGFGVQVSA